MELILSFMLISWVFFQVVIALVKCRFDKSKDDPSYRPKNPWDFY